MKLRYISLSKDAFLRAVARNSRNCVLLICFLSFRFDQVESFNKSQHAREAEEAKGLWESEVRARSKLGSKVSCRHYVLV